MLEYDALLVTSFGGPEDREDVIPFLENVLRGKNVPRARMLEVAEHYYHFGGRSPINGQNRALIAALESELRQAGITFPVYWGNRNWHPFLADTLRRMRADGVRRALAFVTSAFSSYSGCRQYLENIERARTEVAADGTGPAPVVDKLRGFFNHPGFIETVTARVQEAFAKLPPERCPAAALLYTAHSVPVSMARSSQYVLQLEEACRLVSAGLGHGGDRLVWQSRSGPAVQPWLEPDIGAALRDLQARGVADVIVMPIGFISDHMEVLYDLDTEAAALCGKIGLRMVRAGTPGVHPRFIRMIRELIEERISGRPERATVGALAAPPDTCPPGCCPPPQRPAPPAE
jgi:protoporphyrin/coproporphyrin ferrochelatase